MTAHICHRTFAADVSVCMCIYERDICAHTCRKNVGRSVTAVSICGQTQDDEFIGVAVIPLADVMQTIDIEMEDE
jgi:hypothetical protein